MESSCNRQIYILQQKDDDTHIYLSEGNDSTHTCVLIKKNNNIKAYVFKRNDSQCLIEILKILGVLKPIDVTEYPAVTKYFNTLGVLDTTDVLDALGAIKPLDAPKPPAVLTYDGTKLINRIARVFTICTVTALALTFYFCYFLDLYNKTTTLQHETPTLEHSAEDIKVVTNPPYICASTSVIFHRSDAIVDTLESYCVFNKNYYTLRDEILCNLRWPLEFFKHINEVEYDDETEGLLFLICSFFT